MIDTEFNKHAKTYDNYSYIQDQIASKIVNFLDKNDKTILELGSGSGAVYKKIPYDVNRFVGIDFSKNMCLLHPKDSSVEIFCEDFDRFDFDRLKYKFDVIISSSSLQWSKDIKKLLLRLPFAKKHIFSIWTSGSFKNLFDFLGIDSPIKSKEFYHDIFNQYNIETVKKKIKFNTQKELLMYIKKSGVSGGIKRLDYKQAKSLYFDFKDKYLDIEILIVNYVNQVK